MERFPVILYNNENVAVPLNAIGRTNSFFIRAIQRFNVSIVEDTPSNNLLYSVNRKDVPTGEDVEGMFNIVSAKSFTNMDNFAYTLYIESDCAIQYIGIDGIVRSLTVLFRPDNILTPEQEAYPDYLTNYNLPTYEELAPGYIGSNPADMIKRLLLDFRTIMRDKGKKSGIEKFLEFIGFNPDSIVVTDEYRTPNGNITTSPNTLTDVKTGNYHLLFNNWETDPENPFNENNMPLRIITVTDLTDFFKKLFYALTLANVYFTLPEQDINFFGVVDSANGPAFLSVAGVTHVTYEHRVYGWRKDIKIDLFEKQDLNGPHKWIVWNNIQRTNNVDKTAGTTYGISPDLIDDIYTIPRQIYNGEPITPDMDPTQIERVFSSILHLEVQGPIGFYWKYSVVNSQNPMIAITPPNTFIFDNEGDDGLGHDEVILVTNANGTYIVKVWIWDLWNNKDLYTFEYIVNDVNTRLDIEGFDSSNVAEDIESLTGVLHTEITASGGNDDLISSGKLIIVGQPAAVGEEASRTELFLNDAGDSGIADFPTTAAPWSIYALGNQATRFSLKVNGLIYDIPPFDFVVASPLLYSKDDGDIMELNDGTSLSTNDPLNFALDSDGTTAPFETFPKNLKLQAWFQGQVEPLYISLPDDSSPTRDNTILGNIDLDVDSPWTVSPVTSNYVLPTSEAPDDLSGYYDVPTTGLTLAYLFLNKKYIATPINKNFGMNAATDMPTDFMDPWIQLLAIKWIDGFELKIRKVDELRLIPVLIDYFNSDAYGSVPDKLFVTVMDIAEDPTTPETIDAWIFISTMEAGIDLSKELFDFVMAPVGFTGDPMSLTSVYDMTDGVQRATIPVNYDFPMFFRPSSLQPGFINYPPMAPDLTWDELPIIKSIWPRLYRIGSSTAGGSQVLSLGDVFTCRFDQRYVSNCKDIKWTVTNAFDNSLVYETTDYMLKYRVNENIVYNVFLQFNAGSNGNWAPYTITKNAMFSSFTFELDAAAQ